MPHSNLRLVINLIRQHTFTLQRLQGIAQHAHVDLVAVDDHNEHSMTYDIRRKST